LPLIGLYALLITWPLVLRARRRSRSGAAIEAPASFVMLHRLPGAKSGPMTFTTSMLAHHFRLLADGACPGR
jgi:hypothetical protein